MAGITNNTENRPIFSPEKKKMDNNKLRDCGLEYVSNSGRLIAAKTQPSNFCHCPQRCQHKLTKDKWRDLFDQFYGLADQNNQNMFLQAHITIKRLNLHNAENVPGEKQSKRRVSCKYYVPSLDDGEPLELYLNNMSPTSIEVCQKAFMNVFGITEKRVRLQRERSISAMAPDYYLKSEKAAKPMPQLIPMNLCKEPSVHEDKKSTQKRTHDLVCDEPLDLSSHSEKTPSPERIEIDTTKLYEMAEMLGLPKSAISREMLEKYEGLVRKNLAIQQKSLQKKRKVQDEVKGEEFKTPKTVDSKEDRVYSSPENLKGIFDQVVGLQENMAILPIQTLNNGDLTITPVMNASVHNQDIMQVNSFFQNQLWRPEYIGLQGSKNDLC